MDRNRIAVVAAAERVDSASVDDFRQEAERAIEQADALVMDFSETRFIDSVGLGSLVSVLKTCSQRKLPFTIACLSPQVRQIFELTRLYRLFDIFETVEQACVYLEQRDPGA